jgi:hypothetical protein
MKPCPAPSPEPCPGPVCPPREQAPVGASVGGPVSPDGKEPINCHLPGSFHLKNVGGSDGAGLCVFASASHAGVWQSEEAFRAIFQWMRKYPGGGYPEKFDRMLAKLCAEKGLPVPKYFHVEENDFELIKLASKNHVYLCVTYSRSPTGRYGGSKIAHMVNMPHCSDKWIAIHDNNYPGENAYEWMSPETYFKTCMVGGEKMWAIVLLTTPPPPAPKTRSKT